VEVTIERPLISGNLEMIGCTGVHVILGSNVPVLTIEKCTDCQVTLLREDPNEDFQVVTSHSEGTRLLENEDVYEVQSPSPPLR